MKILFLGKRFYTNKDAWAERFGRIFHLPFEWAKSGHEVRLVLLDYHSRESLRATEGLLEVWSSPVPRIGLLPDLARPLCWRPGIVVASGDCYIGLLGWILARVTRARFVFDIYDKYDEFGGYVRPFGFDLFGFLRRRADLKMYSSSPLARALGAEPGDDGVALVANGVDEAVFRPLPRLACRESLGLAADAVLVGYFGGMEPDRGVADLVLALEQLRASGSKVQLLVCGKQHPSTSLQQDWILYRGMVPHSLMPAYINAADVVAIPYRLSPFMDMGSSCKIGEYLMCQRPIASTRTPNFIGNFPVQAQQLGDGLCNPGDATDLARAVEFQLRNRLVAQAPADLTWSSIAARALAAIAGPGDESTPGGSHGVAAK